MYDPKAHHLQTDRIERDLQSFDLGEAVEGINRLPWRPRPLGCCLQLARCRSELLQVVVEEAQEPGAQLARV